MASPLVIPKARFFDSSGAPLVGGKLYSYAAGTSTPKATYTDATGTVPNANPVILDGNGEAAIWLGGAYKLRLADAADVEQWLVDNVKEFLVAPAGAFTLVSSAPTVTGATEFTLPGDYTPFFFANQRVKFMTSTASIYARIVSAIFGAGLTTVVLSNGPINVGAPVGVYAGLGDPGLPIDARHVAYGTAGETVDSKIAQMDATFVDPSQPTTFESVVLFEENVGFSGATVTVEHNLDVEGTVFGKVSRLGLITEGAINTAGPDTVITIPAEYLDLIAAGTYKRLRLCIENLKIDGGTPIPDLLLNGDTGANYAYVMRKSIRVGAPPVSGLMTDVSVYGEGAHVIHLNAATGLDTTSLNPNVYPYSAEVEIRGFNDPNVLMYKVTPIGYYVIFIGGADYQVTDFMTQGRWTSAGVALSTLTITLGSGAEHAVSGTYKLIGEM